MSTKWTKSSHSNASCLQISAHPDGVAIRDSKDPDGPTLVFTQDEWDTFIDRVQTGEFSNPTASDKQ
jgi:hypothetical protein